MTRKYIKYFKDKSAKRKPLTLDWQKIDETVASCCVSISVVASLIGCPVGIPSSAVGIKIFARTVGIKKYESIINKEEKNLENAVKYTI